jgi:translocation and assembly module TamB
MTWKERLIGIPLAVAGAVLLVVTASGMMLTRTDWGRERVRQYALEALNGAIRGEVEIDAVLEGDLLRMVRMSGVRIQEPDGEEFARIDTLTVHYRWSDFLIGNLTFSGATIVGLEAQVEVLPGGGWNFEEVFRDPDPDTAGTAEGRAEGEGRRIVLRAVSIRSGDVTLRMPWNPESGTDPDSGRWHLEESAGTWRRVFRFERLNSRLSLARVVAPAGQGRLFQVTQFSTRATVVGEPFEVEQLRADVEVHGNKLSFDVWQGVLPGSELFGQGWVTLTGEPQYDFTLRGNPVTTDDLMWLVPQLPPGVVTLDYSMRTLPDGIALEAQNARWESGDAAASGRFAMSLQERADGLAFDSVSLDVERASTRLLAELTGWEPPVNGELAGRVELDGPLSELWVDADVRMQPETQNLPTRVSALGIAHIVPSDLGARGLELQFDTVRLDLVRAFVPDLAVRGDVTGSAWFDGRLSEGVILDFNIEQRDGNLAPTRLNGGGTVSADSAARLALDVDVVGESVSLTTLSEYYPAIPIRGDFQGDMQATGPLSDLRVEGRLAGRGDSLLVGGTVRLADNVARYEGELRGWRTRLVPFREGLAESDLDFRVEFEAEGSSLEGLEARGHLDVSSSFVAGVRVDSAYGDLRIAGGRLVVDTAVIRTEFGGLSASGGLGLLPTVSDTLAFQIAADSLGGLNPWLIPEYGPLRPASLAADVGVADEVPAQVEGQAVVSGHLRGHFGRLDARARVEGRRLSYGPWSADTLAIEGFEVSGLGDSTRISGRFTAFGADAGGVDLEAISVDADIADKMAALDFEIRADSATGAEGSIRIRLAGNPQVLGIDALELELGGSTWTLAQRTNIRLSDSGALVVENARLASAEGHVNAAGAVDTSGPAAGRIDLEGVDLDGIASLWPDSLDLAGILSLQAALSGSTEAPVVQGSFEVGDGRLVGVSFSSFRGSLDYRSGQALVDLSMWDDEVRLFRLHGTYPVDLGLPGFGLTTPSRPLRLTLEGDSIPLDLVTLITDQIAEPQGRARAAVDIRGTPDSVRLQGSATLTGGGFRVIRSGIVYQDLAGDLQFDGQDMVLQGVTVAGVQGGAGTLSGTVHFTSLTNPGFDLRLDALALPAYDRMDARLVASGWAELHGLYEEPVIDGDLSIVSGVLFMDEIGRQKEIVDPFESFDGSRELFLLDSVFGEAVSRPQGNVFLDNLTMDLEVEVAQDTWLRSAEANVLIAGDLTVLMRPGEEGWRIRGTLFPVRGDYRFLNKRFEVVEGGSIDFVGSAGMNPNLRIIALYTLRTKKEPLEIRLVIGGTLEEMSLGLESDEQPPISEADLLSYLVFGRPSYELTRTTAEERSVLEDVAADVPQAFFGYALGSLLVGETGIAYIDVTRVRQTSGAQGEYQGGVGPALTATQVEVGWYLAPTVFVSVAQQLVGAVRPTVRLEWRLDDKWTLRGVTEPRFGRAGETLFYGGPGNADIQQSIGLFLFYGWAY